MRLMGVILVLTSLRTVHSQRTPTISYITQEQIKDIGGTVEFACSVQYSQDYPVLWIKVSGNREDQLPISTNTALIIRDSRFSLRSDPSGNTYTLQIKDIQETDEGYYLCQILISTSSKISAEVQLTVRRPPVISDNSTRSVVVHEGQEAIMECHAGGHPTPKISWRRDNNAILPTGGSTYRGNVLKIPSVTKFDRGTYYCVADNGVGRGARRNINLEVSFAPVITAPRPRIGQALTYDQNLECHVEAYPPPGITWLQKDVVLSDNIHYSISHFATADEYTDTTLRVLNIEKSQYGKFTCRAANNMGSAETEVELFETVVPICPPACGIRYYYAAGVIPISSGPILALALLVTLMAR
ncbi:hypothetical protein QAD02_009838 [Eretmocerus hayati]|uniref:Uncharacterized protein n=1 Tax=Eretmocerus hayati TaxID=131215 RepID=A0ACC2NF11_9HYME|nr:hypothetical protein QAD02_009838 [Eretmocerus hayati]